MRPPGKARRRSRILRIRRGGATLPGGKQRRATGSYFGDGTLGMLGRRRRLCLLAEGCFTPLDAKTAVGVLRYRTDQVVAVIDSTRAGRTADACVGVGGGVPVVADLEGAAARGADSLLIGIAPQGGHLPEPWRAMVRAALGRGWDVLSGLHVFLDDEPELASLT